MDLIPSKDQQVVPDTARDVLAGRFPLVELRSRMEGGAALTANEWRGLAELGWFGLSVTDEAGGSGFGIAEEILLFREIGRALLPGPVLAQCLAAHVLAAARTDDLQEAVLSGEARVALAERDFDNGCPTELSVGARVTGAALATDCQGASHYLVVGDRGIALVAREQVAVHEALRSLDPMLETARIEMNAEADAHLDGAAADALLHRAAVLCAAQLVGIAEQTRDLSASYATTREQYGRPIGAFQAVKHRVADQGVRAEAAWFTTVEAALNLEAGTVAHSLFLPAAKYLAGIAAIENARDLVQNYGGIGFTWESDAHLYLKRAHVLDLSFARTRDLLADVLAAPAPWGLE